MAWAAALICLLLAYSSLWTDAQQGSNGQRKEAQASDAPAPGPWGSLLLAGRVLRSEAGCMDAWGASAVTVVIRDLPSSFTIATVTCKFLPARRLAELGRGKGSGLPLSGSQAQPNLVRALQEAPGSPALHRSKVYWEPRRQAQALEHEVTCELPGGLEEVVVALLAETSVSGEGPALLALSQAVLRRVAVFSASPSLGPSSGGTEVAIQGEHLAEPLQCVFSNGSLSLAVRARVCDAGNATCTAPAWPLDRNDAAVALAVHAGGCQAGFAFHFYRAPQPLRVRPSHGPRYGSFAMTVELEGGLQALSLQQAAQLAPVVRLAGAGERGDDLLLAANLTADRRSLMAVTPARTAPLRAGLFPVAVSLNGQQFVAHARQGVALNLTGPSVAMAAPHVPADTGKAAQNITFSVALSGPSMLPRAVASATARPAADLVTAFALVPNQVAYAGDAANMSFKVTAAALPMPAAVRYTLVSQTRAVAGGFVAGGALTGFLEWGEQQGSVLNLTVPVNWTAVAPQAELRLAVQLHGVWNAAVDNATAGNATALHIFGVRPDQCPPGTYRHDDTAASAAAADLQAVPAGQDARLSTIAVQGDAGALFDLSSAFQPNVSEYGTAVPPSFADARLCLRPMQRDALVEVFGPGGVPLAREAPGHLAAVSVRTRHPGVGAAEFPAAAPVAVSAPTPSDSAAAQAGVAAMYAHGGRAELAAACEEGAWPLALAPGQNQFTIMVTAPEAAAQGFVASALSRAVAPAPALAPGPAPGLGPTPGDVIDPALPSASAALEAATAIANPAGASAAAAAAAGVAAAPLAPDLSPPALGPAADAQRIAAAVLRAATDTYSLSVVRLADPEHATVAEVNVTAGRRTYAVCSDRPRPVLAPAAPSPAAAPISGLSVEWVALHPRLRYPGIPGLRVEAGGQVLSQGGDVGADQVEDTTAETRVRQHTDFLPIALVLGLVPGRPVTVPIVVVAEDGVTSLRYYVTVARAPAPARPPGPAPAPGPSAGESLGWGLDPPLGFGTPNSGNGGSPAGAPSSAGGGWGPGSGVGPNGTGVSGGLQFAHGGARGAGADLEAEALAAAAEAAPKALPAGWPRPPGQAPWCAACPAGWASTALDAADCRMCAPGTFAPAQRAPACSACPNGTYANSWGSTHCAHCIIGTHAPRVGSRLCLMCPENATNLEDGSDACTVAVQPGTNLTTRYAVIVSFGVFLNGTSLDDIAPKVGVNASSRVILERLVRADTASAFNISVGDVKVTGVTQVARRMLYVNVTATLGVDVPPGASADDINAALEVASLSADDPIAMLAANPDRFFGRTTKALDVTAEPDHAPLRTESRPPSSAASALARAWPALGAVFLAALLVAGMGAALARRRHRRLFEGLLERCRLGRRRSGWQAQDDVVSGEAPGVPVRPGRQRIISPRVASPRPRALDPLDDARSDPLDRPDASFAGSAALLRHAL
ncbi:hypothetical protein WJX81_003998 [Elliptochloris bilobata]|uniref:Tyrosine-protein kinase ephrin type A/B receptor-like domain-containing protein n=1 Tax=Elliptochloris bilobata TaxID=381761 RepID=A0AAW1RUI1_9CHLO